MTAQTRKPITPAMVPANKRDLLAALAQIEGDSDFGLLIEAIIKGSDLRFDMRAEDVAVCEDYAAQVGDLAYALQERMQTELAGWTA